MSTGDDILGGKLNTKPAPFDTVAYWLKLVFYSALVVGLCALVVSLRDKYLRWREKSYKLAMRRRHGIPDADHRPFNVAYAAAQRIQKDKENNNGASYNSATARLARPVAAQALDQDSLRQRASVPPRQTPTWAAPVLPRDTSNYSSTPHSNDHTLPRLNAYEIASASRHATPSYNYSDSTPEINIIEPTPSTDSLDGRRSSVAPAAVSYQRGSPTKSAYKSLARLSAPPMDSRKRSHGPDDYDVVDGDDGGKRSRLEGGELIDGDEDAGWVPTCAVGSKRGAKRAYDDGDVTGTRGKRTRKSSNQQLPPLDMEIDEDERRDLAEELPTNLRSRGRKRDRAEAGSTFGGDGDDEDSFDDDQLEAQQHDRKSRKRRSTRRSDAFAVLRPSENGTGMDYQDEGSVTASSRRSRRKSHGAAEGGSDVSMSDDAASSVLSKDPLCQGRKIGEEWEVHGVHFKVGPDGERLRQALVKTARSKFNMPRDSIHPDSKAHLDVFVETWLTEDEYEDAKARQALAWQEATGPLEAVRAGVQQEPESPGDVHTPSPVKKTGKDLLWVSTTPETSPSKSTKPNFGRSMYRQSIATTAGFQKPRLNPFQAKQSLPRLNAPSSNGKRLSLGGGGGGGLSDSTNSTPSSGANSPIIAPSSGANAAANSVRGRPRPSRTFSKWEKQDLEAESMRRIRMKAEEEVKRKAGEGEKVGASVSMVSTKEEGKLEPPAVSFGNPPVAAASSSPVSLGASAPSSLGTPTTTTSSSAPKSFFNLGGAPGVDNKPAMSSPLASMPPVTAAAASSSNSAQTPVQITGTGIPKFFDKQPVRPPTTFPIAASRQTTQQPQQPHSQPQQQTPFGPASTSAPTAPTPKFSFGVQNTASPATVPSGGESKSAFGFGPTTVGNKAPEPVQASASNGSSLGPQNSAGAPAPPASVPVFSFGNTASSSSSSSSAAAGAPVSVFGAKTGAAPSPFAAPPVSSTPVPETDANKQQQQQQQPTVSGTTDPLKFKFGAFAPGTGGAKQAATSAGGAPSSLSGALGSNTPAPSADVPSTPQKPAASSTFSFNNAPSKPSAPASSPFGNASSPFGVTGSGTSVFGGGGGSAFGAPTMGSTTTTNPFGAPSSSSSTPSAFGGNTFGGSAFGAPAANINTGGGATPASSIFGAASNGVNGPTSTPPSSFGGNKPAETPKTTFPFGPGTGGGSTVPANTPGFGSNTPGAAAAATTTTPAGAPAFKFNFGTGAGGNTASSPAFAPAAGSAFTFGTSTPSSGAGGSQMTGQSAPSFNFGQQNQQQQQQ